MAMSKLIFQQQTQMTRNQTFTESLSFTDLIRCHCDCINGIPPQENCALFAFCSTPTVPYLPFEKKSRSSPHQVFVVSMFGHLFFSPGFLHHFSDGDSGKILHISPLPEFIARWSLAKPTVRWDEETNSWNFWSFCVFQISVVGPNIE